MLRESSNSSGTRVNLSDITNGLSGGTEVDQAEVLLSLTEAIVARDAQLIEKFRGDAFKVLGNDGLVDSLAVAAAFHGFVRIADAIGIPYDTAAQAPDTSDLREEVGINAFPRIRG